MKFVQNLFLLFSSLWGEIQRGVAVFLFLFLYLSSLGQGWERTYGGKNYEQGKKILLTRDSDLTILSESSLFGVSKVLLIKIDRNGELILDNVIAGTENISPNNFIELPNKDLMIIGSYGYFDSLALVKTDSNCQLIWARTLSFPYGIAGNSIIDINNNGTAFLLCSKDYSSPNYYKSIILCKIDYNGNILWNKEYKIGFEYIGNNIKKTKDGNFVIAGNSTDNNGYHAFLLKIDSNGNTLFQKTYFQNSYPSPEPNIHIKDVVEDIFGNFYIVGNYFGYVFLMKTDSQGTLNWWKTFGDGGFMIAGESIVLDSNNFPVFTGALIENPTD